MAATVRVADVIRSCWHAYNRAQRLPPHVAKAMRHILSCRTAALGGHIHQCDRCGSEPKCVAWCDTHALRIVKAGDAEAVRESRDNLILANRRFQIETRQ